MIGFDAAAALVGALARPLGVEPVGLSEAAGRTLASPIVARIASPRVDVSAMDGYAVHEADLSGAHSLLPVVGQSYAGGASAGVLPHGACMRVFTGAPLPAGADRVVVQETVRREGAMARFEGDGSGRRHVRRAGSDFGLGDVLVEAGSVLTPQRLVAAAAADLSAVEVWRRPRIVVLATGDELAAPGEASRGRRTIPESVSFGVAALAEAWGARVVARRRCGDDLQALERTAGEALERSDLVVVTGGASVGERDYAKAMFAPYGLDLVFDKVALKPGKPVWLGRVGDVLVLGLPGNPTSAMVTARLFLAPLAAGLAGGDAGSALAWRALPLANRLAACPERETFHRARLVDGRAWVGLRPLK